jgi:hypothetical protein
VSRRKETVAGAGIEFEIGNLRFEKGKRHRSTEGKYYETADERRCAEVKSPPFANYAKDGAPGGSDR